MAKQATKQLTNATLDKEFESFIKASTPKAGLLDRIKGLAKFKSDAKAAGIPGWIITLVLPMVEKWLKEHGPEVIQKLIDWVKEKFGLNV